MVYLHSGTIAYLEVRSSDRHYQTSRIDNLQNWHMSALADSRS